MPVAKRLAYGSPSGMTRIQSFTASLTTLDQARAMICDGLKPVAAAEIPLAQALGCISADMPPLAQAYPAFDLATRDGWTFRADDLVGASSYSPVPLPGAPVWVEAGDRLPPGCDCVLSPEMVEQIGALAQVVAETIPGDGVRRAGEELRQGRTVITRGIRIRPADLLIARSIGMQSLPVRRPRVRIVNVPAANGTTSTAQFVAESAREAGADVTQAEATGRSAASIADALDPEACDLLLIVGGTGCGRTDHAVHALAALGGLLAHGIALEPGRTTAIGRIRDCAVVALPGAADQALAAWLTLARPALDRLSGRSIYRPLMLPLARKISSGPGMTDVVLLKREEESWMPLSIGDLSLGHLTQADAWLVVAGDSE